MKEINIEELKLIQLDILQAIHDFCEENHIKYSLACGSMLGAVRHKGYIPWDDDIDVYLMRDDYEKLISSFPKVYKNVYELASLERDSKYARAYARAYNNKTIQYNGTREKEVRGIGIDVYGSDFVPDDETAWLKDNRRRPK